MTKKLTFANSILLIINSLFCFLFIVVAFSSMDAALLSYIIHEIVVHVHGDLSGEEERELASGRLAPSPHIIYYLSHMRMGQETR